MATDWYLVITDGTTTVTIADGSGGATNYKLSDDGWAPAVSALNRSAYGPRYVDVTEDMELNVTGASRAACLANLQTLARLLDQAERWYLGENVDPVLIKYSPKGGTVSSAANPLQAAILGRDEGDETSGMSLPVTFDDLTFNAYVLRARVRFKRRGLWLANTESSGTQGAYGNGAVNTSAFAVTAASLPSPTRLTITNVGWGKSSSARYHGAYVLVGEGGTVPMVVIEAEAGSAPGWSGTADTGTRASGGTVLRYSPSGTAASSSATMGTALMPAGCDLVAVFANVRPSPVTDFVLQGRLTSNGLGLQATPYVAIPATSVVYPRWVFLGQVPISGNILSVGVRAAAGTAASYLEIDSLLLADARNVQALAIVAPGDDAEAYAHNSGTATINHQLLTEPVPGLTLAGTTVLPYKGDPAFYTRSGSVWGALLGSGGGTADGGTSNYWRQVNDAASAFSNTWTVFRREGYLVPE